MRGMSCRAADCCKAFGVKSSRLSRPFTKAVARQYCIENRACISSRGSSKARLRKAEMPTFVSMAAISSATRSYCSLRSSAASIALWVEAQQGCCFTTRPRVSITEDHLRTSHSNFGSLRFKEVEEALSFLQDINTAAHSGHCKSRRIHGVSSGKPGVKRFCRCAELPLQARRHGGRDADRMRDLSLLPPNRRVTPAAAPIAPTVDVPCQPLL